MAEIIYSAEVVIKRGGRVVDMVELDDEDYGFLMKRLGHWANDSEATKDL